MKLLLSILISTMFFNHNTVVVEKWVIERSSNLCIEGRSNVAAFQCDVIEYLKADTISFYKDESQQLQINTRGGLTISVNKIDCHQRFITNDLRKTLKADKIPDLKIELLSVGNFLQFPGRDVKGVVLISLAGTDRKMEVSYTVETGIKNIIKLHGKRDVLFSDFGLTPPSKLAGLVKVEDRLNIRFLLVLRFIQVQQ